MINIVQNIKDNYKLTLSVLVVGILLGLIIGKSRQSPTTTSPPSAEKSIKEQYTCSMHPQIRQDKPGLCPICAMELVLVEAGSSEGEHVDPNEIEMTESALALASVQTTMVKRGIPEKNIQLLGKVKADERRISKLTARFGGRIEKLFVNYTGQQVQKGEKLATIYSPELITAQKELLEAIKYKNENPSFYKSARTKLKLWDLTEGQINAIENDGEPQVYFDILSPRTGTVTKRHVAIGDYVKEGLALFEVIDLSKVWVMFDVYESDLPWVEKGDKIEFAIQSVPGKMYSGRVSYIDPFIDAQTRVAQVRIELNNTDKQLKPEMFVNGILKSNMAKNTNQLLIPKSAILWTGKRAIVYVKVPERETVSFKYREVVLGPLAGNFYVVSKGLTEGEEIATNGVFKIDAAAQLAGKQSMMSPEAGMKPMGHSHGDMTASSSVSEPHKHNMGEVKLKQETFKVSGNCEMCKTTIEKAAKALPGVDMANWDIEKKEIHVSFNDDESSLSDIHKAIAKAGYDTEKETAPKAAYGNLPPCCQYTRASSEATKPNLKQSMFKVSGNCGMCKGRIEETALSLKGVNSAEWDEKTKMLQLTYNLDKIKELDIHKAIAKVGHDTEKATAPTEVYKNLPECCKYTRE